MQNNKLHTFAVTSYTHFHEGSRSGGWYRSSYNHDLTTIIRFDDFECSQGMSLQT